MYIYGLMYLFYPYIPHLYFHEPPPKSTVYAWCGNTSGRLFFWGPIALTLITVLCSNQR